MLTPWFKAHDISQADACYVQSAKFCKEANVFISATSHGEVKIWENSNKLSPLGTLNHSEWNPSRLFEHMSQKVNRNEAGEDLDHIEDTNSDYDAEM